MEAIKAKINGYDTVEIMKIAKSLKDDFRDGADMVMSAALEILEVRMNEDTFIRFCGELE